MELANFCDSFTVFKNGQEAIDYLRPCFLNGDKVPELILLDLNMPVMDGWQFLDEFVRIPCEKKVVLYVVTSSINPQDIKRARLYEEVTDYAVKPVTLHQLKKILENFPEEL